MALLAKNNPGSAKESADRFGMIEEEAVRVNRSLKALRSGTDEQDLPEFEFKDLPINTISYGKHHEYEPAVKAESYDDIDMPVDFFYSEGQFADGKTDYDLAGKRILLAEGNKLTGEVIRSGLAVTGARVDSVPNGKAAVIEFVSRPVGTYDLVLADLDLDELDGFSVVKCIRISGKEDGESIPVYALCADTSVEEIKKACKYGFNAAFAMPVDIEGMCAKMERDFSYCLRDQKDSAFISARLAFVNSAQLYWFIYSPAYLVIACGSPASIS